MSPQTSRSPGWAAGDATEAYGRHRRPQSLADTGRSVAGTDVSFRVAADDRPIVRWGDGRAHQSTPRGWTAPQQRRPEHGRPEHVGRHSVAGTTPARRPVIGAHRAPGTLPIESWLLIGKTRQQALLASLVAVGLLLVALPAEQKPSGVDPVNAAAQRAAGANTAKNPATGGRNTTQGGDSGQGADQSAPPPAPTAATTTPSPATPVSQPSSAAGRQPNGAGPGRSLRTTGSRAIALTFDDGPDPVQTPKILALLDEYQVKATFCLVGQQAQKHPEVVRQIVAAGHTLCNHTWSHSLTIGKDSPAKINADLARTDAAIRAAVPDAAIPYFRAPGGNFTDRLVSVADQAGMTSLYWEVDPRDWDHPAGETATQHVDRVIADIRKNIRPGAIVLSHDFNQPGTIAAYTELLPWLKENFVIGMPGHADGPANGGPASADAPATPEPAATTPGASTAPTE